MEIKEKEKENKRLSISRPIIVEGRYDREKLLSFVDGTVVTTEGFAIFNSRERMALIRRLAERGGVIVLTDSDGAGAVIRSHITSSLPKGSVTQLYIPRVEGKERRKKAPSRAGTLGVEGIDADTLYELLRPFSDGEARASDAERTPVTKADMYACGLSGADGAAERRDAAARLLGLPPGMTPNAFLAAVNVLTDRDGFLRIAEAAKQENNGKNEEKNTKAAKAE